MPMIYAFGETVLDIIFDDAQPVAAKAGGAMLNTAVSLGRSGHHVSLVTEFGNDRVGKMILDFLHDNHVGTDHIVPYQQFRTPLALAFLNGDKSADYSFYKYYPPQRLEQEMPVPRKGDVLLFGSFYSLNHDIRGKLTGLLQKARENGALVIYDPNIRKNHMQDLTERFHYIMENIQMADIVRGSDEDFENLFNCCEEGKVFKQVEELGCDHLVITRGSSGADLIARGVHINMPAKDIAVVSTIGAGDAFNAGLVHGILQLGVDRDTIRDLSPEEWKAILQYGLDFAGDTCRSLDNYISLDFGNKLRTEN